MARAATSPCTWCPPMRRKRCSTAARHRRGPDERRERFRQFAALLQFHEQRAVRRSEGAAGRRYRAQRLSRRGLGRRGCACGRRRRLYVTTGVYEVNQGLYSYANFRTGFKFDTSQDSGVYLPVEIGWEPSFGAAELPGHYKIGFGYDTSSSYRNFANCARRDGLPGCAPRTHRGNTPVLGAGRPDAAPPRRRRRGRRDRAGRLHPQRPATTPSTPSNISPGCSIAASGPRGRRTRVGLLFTYNTVSGLLGKVQAAGTGVRAFRSATAPPASRRMR